MLGDQELPVAMRTLLTTVCSAIAAPDQIEKDRIWVAMLIAATIGLAAACIIIAGVNYLI